MNGYSEAASVLERASPAHYESTDNRLQALESEIRATIKRLAQFESEYARAEKHIVSGEMHPLDIPERLVQNLNQTVSRFRGLEIAWKNIGEIQGLESEYKALRRIIVALIPCSNLCWAEQFTVASRTN